MNTPFLSTILTTVALLASFLCLPSVESKEEERSLDDVTDYLPFFIETVAREYSDSKSVAFDELKNSSFFVKNLDFMRRRLKTIDPQTLNVEERKAFFINIYNILVLDTLSSLTPIPQSLEGISDFEHRKVLNIAKRNYTLSSIKHGILRGNSRDISTNELYFDEETRKHVSVPKDPRILSALYSPTKSGPSLHAFVSDTLEQKLDAAMIRMCEEGVILKGNSLIIVSSVFEDFMSDFAPTKNKLLRWLSECVEDTNKKIALYFAALDDTFMSYSFEKFDTNITVLVRDPEEKKIKVDLYIQSLCSDVSGFFTTQLHPSFEKIKKFIDLKIIVFGKASVTPISDGEDFKFECQNGPLECLGNKIMSCVVEYLPVDIQVPFLTCLLTSPSISKGVKECGKKNAVPTLAIEECSKSIEGSRLLYANGLKTLELEPKLYVVPTITINKVYNSSILRNSLKHFSSYICSIYMDTYQKDYGISTPAGCQVKIEVYIDSLSTDVHKFFDLQLIPTWNRVGHSMDLEIIPYGNTEITGGGDLTDDIVDLPSQMRCPRGPLECYGNIVMSCMAELLSTETQINLFKCMMNKKTASLKGKECADEEGVAWQPIHECIEGSLGSELILRNKNKTESLPQGLSFIPTVTVNKIHNRTFTEWALNDLTALVCDAFLMSTEDQETPVSLPRGCPVRVEIYLEMLCSDTKRFFLKVFHPTWKKLQPLIDLHLVPFGKANVWLNDESKDYEFECQNGPLECQGNKIMSCAVEYLPLNLQVEFIACLFQSRFPSNAGKECSEKLHLPWETLRNCSTSREGSELLFQNGIRTMNLKPALFFVPTITLNRYYDSQALTDSLNNLDDQVCRVYQKPFIGSAKVLTPKGCKLMLEVYFISFSKDSTTFLLRQLLPVWKKFHDEISLELIPIGKLPTYFHNETDFEESCRKSTSCAADLTFACVIKYFKIEVQMELLECSLESGDSLATSKSCTQKYQFSWSKISKCIRGTEGFSLLKQNLYRTRKLRPSFHSVPTILVNGFYDKKELKKSRSDLQRVICNSFYDPLTSKTWKPRRCPVTLEVFIASLCPDTKDFFLHQLQPTWKELSSIMDLRIIPFGKASAKLTNADTNEYEFKCQHGPLECYGNRVMSCIVHHYQVEDQVRMLSCMFSKDYPAVEGRECAEDLNLDWASITACIDKEGASLLYENGIKTERVRPKILFIPTTTVNGLYSKIIGRKSFKNLLGLVCSTYLGRMNHGEKEEILEGCKVPVEVFFHSLDEGMRYFFSEEAEEFWRVFKRIVHIKFLPFKDLLNQESYEDCSRNKCYLSHFLACLTNDETTNLQMEFLACLMSQEDPELGIKPCSKELEVNFEAIDSCTSSSKSLNILQENTESFLKFQKPDHKLPLVVVRKSFLHKNRRLKTLACKNFFGPTPHECLKNE